MLDDPYAITAQEREEYQAFRLFHLRQLYRPLPESLWHYTTASTFALIMETQKIWATQISCLNDHMEFRHSVKLVREAIRVYKAPKYDPDTQRWVRGRRARG